MKEVVEVVVELKEVEEEVEEVEVKDVEDKEVSFVWFCFLISLIHRKNLSISSLFLAVLKRFCLPSDFWSGYPQFRYLRPVRGTKFSTCNPYRFVI